VKKLHILFMFLFLFTTAFAGEAKPVVKTGEKLAFLGDSITEGGGGYGYYCRLVIHGLKRQGVDPAPAVFAGISGNTSADMLARLEKDVLVHKPDWVILAAGVNDIWHGDPTVKIGVFQPKPGMGVGLEDYRKNVTTIADRCAAAGAKLVLTTITPITEDPAFKLNLKAQAYNAFLYELAKERNLRIAPLHENMFAEIAKGTRLTGDGVHPTEVGHRLMARGILHTLGLGTEDTAKLEKEWSDSPKTLILGDRQTMAGGRTGGWCHMLLDGMNSGLEMMTYHSIGDYRKEVTLENLAKRLPKIETEHVRFFVLQAPRGDALAGTAPADYTNHLETLLAWAKEKQMKPILVTIPVQENNPNAELSKKLVLYNDILRKVAKTRDIPLADIQRAMTEAHAAFPDRLLTYDGERFNHDGAMMMAETLLRAMDLESVLTDKLRKIWCERPSYLKQER